MRDVMKYCKQTSLSVLSSVLIMIVYYLLSVLVIKEIKQDIWHILLYISIVVSTLVLNFIFGYRFSDKLQKSGFIVQFIFLLIISVVIISYENTFIYYIGAFINPIYIYVKEIIWYFNASLSNTALIKGIMVVLSSILPSLLMFLGFKIAQRSHN